MPTYQYRCTNCGHEIEAVQKFSDPALTTCDQCQGTLRKVFSPVGVVFKGSGFYATDNRSKNKGTAATSSSTDKGGEKAGTTSDTGKAATPSGSGDAPAPSAPASTPKPATGGATSGSTTA